MIDTPGLVLAAAALAAFIWTAYNRASFEVDWPDPAPDQLPPEHLWTYNAPALESWAQQAESKNLLDFYRRRLLLGSDLAFAITLAALSTYVCYRVALTPIPRISWIALPAAAMSVLYGIVDVAEDLKLAAILKHPKKVDHGEAAAANMLTRVKRVTLTLSLVGLGLFWIYLAINYAMVAWLKGRKPKAHQADLANP